MRLLLLLLVSLLNVQSALVPQIPCWFPVVEPFTGVRTISVVLGYTSTNCTDAAPCLIGAQTANNSISPPHFYQSLPVSFGNSTQWAAVILNATELEQPGASLNWSLQNATASINTAFVTNTANLCRNVFNGTCPSYDGATEDWFPFCSNDNFCDGTEQCVPVKRRSHDDDKVHGQATAVPGTCQPATGPISCTQDELCDNAQHACVTDPSKTIVPLLICWYGHYNEQGTYIQTAVLGYDSNFTLTRHVSVGPGPTQQTLSDTGENGRLDDDHLNFLPGDETFFLRLEALNLYFNYNPIPNSLDWTILGNTVQVTRAYLQNTSNVCHRPPFTFTVCPNGDEWTGFCDGYQNCSQTSCDTPEPHTATTGLCSLPQQTPPPQSGCPSPLICQGQECVSTAAPTDAPTAEPTEEPSAAPTLGATQPPTTVAPTPVSCSVTPLICDDFDTPCTDFICVNQTCIQNTSFNYCLETYPTSPVPLQCIVQNNQSVCIPASAQPCNTSSQCPDGQVCQMAQCVDRNPNWALIIFTLIFVLLVLLLFILMMIGLRFRPGTRGNAGGQRPLGNKVHRR
jgi:hypothetical protein